MKILWANRYCLLDTSSGASRSVREILELLSGLGHDVKVVGATVFDAPVGQTGLGDAAAALKKADKPVVNVKSGPLTHQLVKTKSTASGDMTLMELNALYSLFRSNLEAFHPDVVFHYGGNSFDMLIPSEAKRFGAVTAAYLANPNYMGSRWHDDVDLVFTDSRATAGLYKEKIGLDVIPVGKFIDPEFVVAEKRDPKHVTFVNPSVEKGAALVAQVALEMEKRRPDIMFEVVQSRGDWNSFLTAVQSGKKKRKALKNVIITPNSRDMRPVYARSKVLFAPSFWWESGARVLAEAMLNGIPAVTTRHGGSVEMIGDAGVALTLPQGFHDRPYNKMLGKEGVSQVCQILERFFDDDAYYLDMSRYAKNMGISRHNGHTNILTIEAALNAAAIMKRKALGAGNPHTGSNTAGTYAIDDRIRENHFAEVTEDVFLKQFAVTRNVTAPILSEGKSKLKLVTAADKKMQDYAKYLESSSQKFGLEHVFYDMGELGFGKSFRGEVSDQPFKTIPAKPRVILDAANNLVDGDYIMWLDADTVVKRDVSVIKGNYDLGVCLRKRKSTNIKESWLNAGVIVLRVSKKIKNFLEEWSDLSMRLGSDQFALNQILFPDERHSYVGNALDDLSVRGFRCEDLNNFYNDSSSKTAYVLHYKMDIRASHPLEAVKK